MLKTIRDTTNKKTIRKSTHVPSACIHCKTAHLACDVSRPCKRCVGLGKADSCIDIKHKKRGRPRLTAIKKWQSATTKSPTISHYHTIVPQDFKEKKQPLLYHDSPALFNTHVSSFKLSSLNNIQKKAPVEAMTMLLSMELCCARTSDECVAFLNKYPSELNQRSFYDLVDNSFTLSKIHRTLLDNCHKEDTQPISFLSTNSPIFSNTDVSELLTIANGSQTLKCPVRFKAKPDLLFDAQFYLGGGLGCDLVTASNLNRTYIVCIITRSSNPSSPQSVSSMGEMHQDYQAPITPPPSCIPYILNQQDLSELLNSWQPQKLNDQPINNLLFNDNTPYWFG